MGLSFYSSALSPGGNLGWGNFTLYNLKQDQNYVVNSGAIIIACCVALLYILIAMPQLTSLKFDVCTIKIQVVQA